MWPPTIPGCPRIPSISFRERMRICTKTPPPLLLPGEEHGDAESVRLHLLANIAYQRGLVSFLENHDEPRAAATFAAEKARAAAVTMLAPPRQLYHEGQFEGRKVRLPVFLGHHPNESTDRNLQAFYQRLLTETARDVFRNGRWRLCDRSGWPDNPSHLNIVAWCWELGEGASYHGQLLGHPFLSRHPDALGGSPGKAWRLSELLSVESYERRGDEMADQGSLCPSGRGDVTFPSLNPVS